MKTLLRVAKLLACWLLLCPTTAPAAEPDDADVGVGGTTVQLPTFGVAIDADGVLKVKEVRDPGGRLLAARIAAARAKLGADVAAPSKLRFISLNRLEDAIEKRLRAGEPLGDEIESLAGLQRVQYAMLLSDRGDPDTGDVVIAGPAEGWVDNGGGHVVGVNNGRPVIQLQHLLVALRMFPPGGREAPFVGCTIDPTPEGLRRLQVFQRQVPKVVPQQARTRVAIELVRGTREALGMANVRVFGVPANTHFAKILIEADYHMKLIGIGVVAPPVKMTTFIGALRRSPGNALQRWWFTPNYKCVRVADDRLAMELVGRGVQLQSEDKVIGPDGRLLNRGAAPNKASDAFAASFTERYADIAAVSPVFGQMRNCIDLLVAAAFLQREDYYGQVGWDAKTLGDEKALPTQTLHAPKQAPCAANSVWKGSRLLSPAGGGVSIQPLQALTAENLLKDDGTAAKVRAQIASGMPKDRWWWD